MGARFRSLWQKIRKPLVLTGFIAACALAFVFIVGFIGGYIFNWDWTGINGGYSTITTTSTSHGITTTTAKPPEKSLWDWLQLLIIPAALAVGGYLFNFTNSRNEQRIASDNQRETELQGYIDKMSDLLLKEHLRESVPEKVPAYS